MHVSFTARHFCFKRFSRYNVLYRSTSHHTLYRNGIIKDGSRDVCTYVWYVCMRLRSPTQQSSKDQLTSFTSAFIHSPRSRARRDVIYARDDSGCNGGHFNNAKPTIIRNRAPYRGDGWRTIALSLQSVVIRSKRSDV